MSDADFIKLLYQNYLHRTPDQNEIGYYQAKLTSGYTRQGIETEIAGGPERALVGSTVTTPLYQVTSTNPANNVTGTLASYLPNSLANISPVVLIGGAAVIVFLMFSGGRGR